MNDGWYLNLTAYKIKFKKIVSNEVGSYTVGFSKIKKNMPHRKINR